ncbi:MurR/RpiR family transcriptional regulator [Clostridium paraputrificum]|uniref:MurR/RpiR family transcriptional regulator n=1 Tax=Clostridium paraputrificum TaxID=29363 RepID=UPI00232C7D60|nr:MurR/RpiR family transcriptional regulator [Clostridium paraputrificum]MDB2105826.1 MurR/RpiR family transcriptional regulator [Clostridium paraputrificum]MDB2112702.1 MurR/RpiR family transcriptional regulator [Clostridium paraputrificum]
MDVIEFIKQNYNSFTEREKKIADYLMESKESIIEMSARDIADKTNTSAPTVVRFAKKIGFNSLNEMKLKISINLEKKDENKSFEYLESNLETKSIIYGIKNSIHSVIDKTIDLIDEKELDKAIKLLVKANNIYVFSIGSSGLVGLDLYYKLSRINKRCIVHSDTHLQLTSSVLVDKDDVVVAISYSGETREILKCVENAKANGAPIISITKASINNKLEALSDITLKVPSQEKSLREGAISSRMSQLAIIDILFLGIARDNVKEVEEKLIATRKAIEYLK